MNRCFVVGWSQTGGEGASFEGASFPAARDSASGWERNGTRRPREMGFGLHVLSFHGLASWGLGQRGGKAGNSTFN